MLDATQVPIRRYVALGDSSTEGLDDPKASGGFRGWSERLATHIADAQGPLEYANLAVRGKNTREVKDEQLAAALALQPDFASLFVGTNDVTARHFGLEQLMTDFEEMLTALRGAGAQTLSFTLPDLTPVMPLARFVAGRVVVLNDVIREVCARTGTICVDFAREPLTSDARLWSADRIHANSEGHGRMSSAMADALGLPGHRAWNTPLPGSERRSALSRVAGEFSWWTRYFAPWIGRSMTGRTSGDGIQPKYPTPVQWGPQELV